MHQHSVESSHDRDRSRDGEEAERDAAQPQLRRMVAVPGLAVPRPAAGPGDPVIRRTLIDNAVNPAANLTTERSCRTTRGGPR